MKERLHLPVGTILHKRYQIVELLGKGGMGAVYEAVDNTLSSSVAIKETFATDDYLVSAFEREAKLLANLDHEAFPRVMDYFAEKDGYFLVMELIRGKDLKDLLAENGKPFEVETVLNWADQLLDALEDLHSQGIVHRDIKPANIKLNQRGKIKLIDFGIAKGTAGDLTKIQTTLGSFAAATMAYAPLEQILRSDTNSFEMLCVGFFEKTNEILQQGTDERADIYALGATLYQLLTNRFPVNAPTRALKVWSGHNDKLIPVHQINLQVSVKVSEVLQKAMAIERGNRISTASGMREMLADWRQNKKLPIQSAETQRLQRNEEEAKRRIAEIKERERERQHQVKLERQQQIEKVQVAENQVELRRRVRNIETEADRNKIQKPAEGTILNESIVRDFELRVEVAEEKRLQIEQPKENNTEKNMKIGCLMLAFFLILIIVLLLVLNR